MKVMPVLLAVLALSPAAMAQDNSRRKFNDMLNKVLDRVDEVRRIVERTTKELQLDLKELEEQIREEFPEFPLEPHVREIREMLVRDMEKWAKRMQEHAARYEQMLGKDRERYHKNVQEDLAKLQEQLARDYEDYRQTIELHLKHWRQYFADLETFAKKAFERKE